ncbi:IS3 family transposase [Aquibacillus koreensis]|uniref:IS3 family transposase n=1 Tax=Aquibacillus koreensis TaxID=279446 RepID=UPI0021A2E25A|nr:IS3 family transposase [Aquibacillus koreensis]MCT2536221.1 IS3 family transposase [Aquibacillus koreensis]
MGNKNTGKKYNEDFKKMIVDLYNSGSSAKDLSSEYGVSEVTIYAWIKKFSPIKTEDGDTVTADEIAKMKKQMLKLQEENDIFKKGYGHIREEVTLAELTTVIDAHKDDHSVKQMCDVLGVSKSTYYQTKKHVESNRDRENREITERIKDIHAESKQRYGAHKIYESLKKEGYNVSIKRVQRLMKKAGIRSIIVKKFRPTPSKETVIERDNILKQDFNTTNINQKWVGDITYINTLRDGWCYLASVMDLHTKKIIGYAFSRSMTTELVLKALDNAYITQQPNDGVVFHSDLGSQYTSEDFRQRIQSYGMDHSFSRKGCPYDNACIESFHAILKKEEVNHVRYLDFNSANIELFKYIEGWYNRKRIHGSIAYKTPQELENELNVHVAA